MLIPALSRWLLPRAKPGTAAPEPTAAASAAASTGITADIDEDEAASAGLGLRRRRAPGSRPASASLAGRRGGGARRRRRRLRSARTGQRTAAACRPAAVLDAHGRPARPARRGHRRRRGDAGGGGPAGCRRAPAGDPGRGRPPARGRSAGDHGADRGEHGPPARPAVRRRADRRPDRGRPAAQLHRPAGYRDRVGGRSVGALASTRLVRTADRGRDRGPVAARPPHGGHQATR